jgi:hypothetical protein
MLVNMAFRLFTGLAMLAGAVLVNGLEAMEGPDFYVSVGTGGAAFSIYQNRTTNQTVRFNEIERFCDMTPGVRSYAGFIDLNNNSHAWFWFIEARQNKASAPVTLWLDGLAIQDPMAGLLQRKV